jgi:hypothetical protein
MAATGVEVGPAMDLTQKGSSGSLVLGRAAVAAVATVALWTTVCTFPSLVAFAGA